MKQLLIFLIVLYQKTLSPDHGWFASSHPHGFCRFSPSCSDYAKQSIETHGALRGGFLAIARISRCHPWSAPGSDPVLNNQTN
jgi:putative membrane protein insertion efficiency factor